MSVSNSSNHQTPALIFPGTFKSMLHGNSTVGDITITIAGVSNLNALLTRASNEYPPSPPMHQQPQQQQGVMTLKSDQFQARVQLTYRSHSNPPADSPQQPRRSNIICNGKIMISSSSSFKDNDDNNGSNAIKQYEMIFVQAEFEPGQPFFAVNFSKTLVQNISSNDYNNTINTNNANVYKSSNENDEVHVDRGLMLSGHYSNLRGYDIGTVRVHLPPGSIVGDLAPGPYANAITEHSPALKHSFKAPTQPNNSNNNEQLFMVIAPPGLQQQQQQQQQPPSSPYFSPKSHQRPHFDSNSSTNNNTPTTHINSNKPVRYCYGCGDTGHLHKDCPRDQLFCYNCNETGHSSKNCKKPKPWEEPASNDSPQPQGKKHQNQNNLPSVDAPPFTPQASWNMKPLNDSLPPINYSPKPPKQFTPPNSSPGRAHQPQQSEIYGAVGSSLLDIDGRRRGYSASFAQSPFNPTVRPKRNPSFSYAPRPNELLNTDFDVAFLNRLTGIEEESPFVPPFPSAQFGGGNWFNNNNNNTSKNNNH